MSLGSCLLTSWCAIALAAAVPPQDGELPVFPSRLTCRVCAAWFAELEDIHAPEIVQVGTQDYSARVSGPVHANPNSPARGGWIEVARLDFAVPESFFGQFLWSGVRWLDTALACGLSAGDEKEKTQSETQSGVQPPHSKVGIPTDALGRCCLRAQVTCNAQGERQCTRNGWVCMSKIRFPSELCSSASA